MFSKLLPAHLPRTLSQAFASSQQLCILLPERDTHPQFSWYTVQWDIGQKEDLTVDEQVLGLFCPVCCCADCAFS